MPKVYSIDGIVPVVHSSAFVHPSAVLIGDVIVGARAYIGPAACLRGDFGRIVVEEGANIQDTCMLHGFPGKDAVVGAGIPARALRELSDQELKWKNDNVELYKQLAVRSLGTMREVEALTEIEPNRKRIDIPGAVPLSELKKKHG